MIWALLAFLGVPIWLVVGALAGALVSRRRARNQPGVVRMKVRPLDADRWPRRASYGQAVHDVLIVRVGLALARTVVRGVAAGTERTDAGPVNPFATSHVLQLTFDDGSGALVAVDAADARHLASLVQPGSS